MYYCIDYEVVTIVRCANSFNPTAGLNEIPKLYWSEVTPFG